MTISILWNDYHIQLKAFISKRINDTETVNDILQSVFLKIHSELENKKRIGNIKAWLFRITRNTIIDFYRTKKISEVLPDNILEEDNKDSVAENVAGSIRFFINQLNDESKKILILSEIKGMSQKEISKVMGLPYSTIKSKVQRARTKVKQMMLDCCHYEFDKFGKPVDYICKNC